MPFAPLRLGGDLPMEDRWLSVAEIAVYLGIREQTLYKWISRKPDMPAHKVGRLWKFKVSEIDEWVRAGGAAPRPGFRGKREK